VAPEEGINALVAAARALAGMRLGRIDAQTTANFGVISGGTASNVVPERVHLVGEARSHSERALEAQTRHMTDLLEQHAASVGARAEVKVSRAYGKIEVSPDSPLIRSVSAAIRACGLEPRLQPTGGGSDANVLNAAGVTAVNLGTGYTGPHSLDEQVAVVDLVKIAEVVRALITAP
jgi:tripeptide aminopeptidase